MIARALCLMLAVVAGGAQASDDRAFRLGVRTDASPFAFLKDDGGYGGFLYDMCRAAVAFAGVDAADVELIPVTAATRFEALDDPEGPDLLCDPTTITMERLARWDFTPIVFFANSTVLRRNHPVLRPVAQAPTDCAVGEAREFVLMGWVEQTTSDRTVADLAGDAAVPAGGAATCAAPFARHVDGLRDICSEDGAISFYVGDADILSAQLEALRREGLPCRVAFDPRSSWPEPYALILGPRTRDLQQRITAGIYAFFRSDAAERSFAANFGDRRKSPTLAMLFELYQIPLGAPLRRD